MAGRPDPQLDSQRPPGISLEELTEAYAQAMGSGPGAEAETQLDSDTPAEPETADPVAEQPEDRPAEQEPEAADDDFCEISPRSILEAMLFVGNRESRSLSAVRAAGLMRGVEPEEIAGFVGELNRRYAANGCPYHVGSEGGGYRLTLRKAFHPLRNRFYGRVREARLSQAAIDVLAVVAYQQPLTSEEIGRLRGKPSSHLLAQLVRRGLLRIERRQAKRRTAQYFTTDRFLELFGLESLDDLPQSEELDRQ